MKMLKDWLKTDVIRQLVPLHVNLLIQKTTAVNDDKPTYITTQHTAYKGL